MFYVNLMNILMCKTLFKIKKENCRKIYYYK